MFLVSGAESPNRPHLWVVSFETVMCCVPPRVSKVQTGSSPAEGAFRAET